jgi:hypothetical protein
MHSVRTKLDDPVIYLLVDRDKSGQSSTCFYFNYYEDKMLVSEFLRRGGTQEDIQWDIEHHYIRLQTIV